MLTAKQLEAFPFVDVFVSKAGGRLAVGVWTFRFLCGNGLNLLLADSQGHLIMLPMAEVGKVSPHTDDSFQCVVDTTTGLLQVRKQGTESFKTIGCVSRRPNPSFVLAAVVKELGLTISDIHATTLDKPRAGHAISERSAPVLPPTAADNAKRVADDTISQVNDLCDLTELENI